LISIIRLFLLSFVCVLGLFALDATAQTPQPPATGASINIAILDMASIRRKATVIENILTQLKNYREEFSKNIQKEDAGLKAANQELLKKRTLLSPEAFSQEQKNFQEKVVAFQNTMKLSTRALDIVNEKAMFKVDQVLNGIIEGIAEKRGLNLILKREFTVLTSRSLDITEDVINELNAKLPEVKVEKPVIQ